MNRRKITVLALAAVLAGAAGVGVAAAGDSADTPTMERPDRGFGPGGPDGGGPPPDGMTPPGGPRR